MATTESNAEVNWEEHLQKTINTLNQLYKSYVFPVESLFQYDLFDHTYFEETILNSKPFITFFGPWSSGKSTFINYLLQQNHLWTGPQPTTSEFTVVIHGEEATPIDGTVVTSSSSLPFKGLQVFGDSFISSFKGYQANHDLLKSVILVDTPGVLESATEMYSRGYDHVKVSRWFAERSDLIFILFDPAKMDSGEELHLMFKHAFKGFENKIRIVLNKADSINTQELMRVYGCLFWNLSSLITTTEPPRVYVGSFWNKPYQPDTFSLLFTEEKIDLMHEITEIVPTQSLDKKVASLIKRTKNVFVHAVILSEIRATLPKIFGKEKAKIKALDKLPQLYERIGAKFKMNHKDFPPVERYKEFINKIDLDKIPTLDKLEKDGHIKNLLHLMQVTLPKLLSGNKVKAMKEYRERRTLMQQNYHQSIINQYEGVTKTQSPTLQDNIYAVSSPNTKPHSTEQTLQHGTNEIESQPNSDLLAQEQDHTHNTAQPSMSIPNISALTPEQQQQLLQQLQALQK